MAAMGPGAMIWRELFEVGGSSFKQIGEASFNPLSMEDMALICLYFKDFLLVASKSANPFLAEIPFYVNVGRLFCFFYIQRMNRRLQSQNFFQAIGSNQRQTLDETNHFTNRVGPASLEINRFWKICQIYLSDLA